MKTQPLTVLVSAITAAVVSLALVFAINGTPSRGGAGTTPESVYQQVQTRGTIRAAYVVGAPLFAIDPNTKAKSGIFYDIINAAAKRLGLRVDWVEEVGYAQMIQGLKDHRYDIVGSGVWINSDRARSADFTIPVYYDAVYAYAKVGDQRFSADLENLNSKQFTISTMDGELGKAIAQTSFPNARTLELPQTADFSQLVINVVDGKADIVFLANAPARSYQAANPGKIIAVNSDKPLRIFPNAVLLPQAQFELRQALNVTLTEMLNDGEIDAILRKYEKVPGSFLRVAQPYEARSAK